MNTKEKIKSFYFTGASTTLVVILLTIIDIAVGSSTGGDLTSIPQTSVDKFIQIQENILIGLYNLDLLNMIVSVVMIPSVVALYLVLRHDNEPFAFLSLVIFIIGTTVFIANNSALPMLDLSRKFHDVALPDQKAMIAAAGEAVIAKGGHGTPGVFLGFILITVSELIISVVMFRGTVFSRATAYTGTIGTSLLVVYLVLVTFYPSVKEYALMLAAPGGILSLIWMSLFTRKLFNLAKK